MFMIYSCFYCVCRKYLDKSFNNNIFFYVFICGCKNFLSVCSIKGFYIFYIEIESYFVIYKL